nr:cysteine hydrolase [Acidobacteriota bacterium]
MKHTAGLDLPETVADAISRERTALIVYDMQVGIMRQLKDGAAVLAGVLRVLEAARDAG